MQEFNELLYKLLNRLDAIAGEYPEADDTAVREEMSTAILNGFCRKVDDDKLPDKFGMHSLKGNIDIMALLAFFIGNAREIACLDTFHKRLAALQESEVISDNENNYGWYFGHWNPEDFDENGNRLDGRDI